MPAKPTEAIQSTESIVGPYALQDFNLYYTLRYGFAPSKVAYLAEYAWADAAAGDWPANVPDAARRAYDLAEIRSWLRVFLARFFGFSQFKRSAMPNGPKISSGGSLSPRGGAGARRRMAAPRRGWRSSTPTCPAQLEPAQRSA